MMNQKIRKAVIPAAGLGTRFLPATKAQPKEMLPIVDKPVIQFVVEEAVNAGIEEVIIVTGPGKRSIEEHFTRNFGLESVLREKNNEKGLEELEKIEDLAQIKFAFQEKPLGLGHSVLCAEKFVGNEPFAVLLGDTIVQANSCMSPLMKVFEKYGNSVVAVEEVEKSQVQNYGIVSGKKIGGKGNIIKVDSLVEKPSIESAPSNLAIFGRYVFTPQIFDCLQDIKPGKGGELQLTDAINLLCLKESVYAFLITEKRYDIGLREQYFKAFVEFALERKDIGPQVREYLKTLKL